MILAVNSLGRFYRRHEISLYLFKQKIMEELLIKVKDEKESSFIKDLLKKLKIQFETINETPTPSGEEIKESVISGQIAYKSGKTYDFQKINRKDVWK